MAEGPAAAMVKKRIKLHFSTQFTGGAAVPVTGALYLFFCSDLAAGSGACTVAGIVSFIFTG